MVRFAYETGLKCLYSNLPGNLSLVTNHREKGENYGRTMVNILTVCSHFNFIPIIPIPLFPTLLAELFYSFLSSPMSPIVYIVANPNPS